MKRLPILVVFLISITFGLSEPASDKSLESSSSIVFADCDPAYPTVCIPSPPPDLDCGEISYKNFKVLSPDPHGFDRDRDGVGCES